MSRIPHQVPAQTLRPTSPDWHAPLLAMLPAIQRHAQRAFRRLPADARDEAVQAVVAHCALAYRRLVAVGKSDVAYATPLAEFAVRQYRAGRQVGTRANSRDITAAACQRRHGFEMETQADWKLALAEDRRTTPADLAALRVDFADWLTSLTPRNRQMAQALAAGEPTGAVAQLFRVTASRISQLRRELYASWRQFAGETPAMA